MSHMPDVDEVRTAYIEKRVGELMRNGSRQDDVEAIAEEEFQAWLDAFTADAMNDAIVGGLRAGKSFTMPPWSDTLNGRF